MPLWMVPYWLAIVAFAAFILYVVTRSMNDGTD